MAAAARQLSKAPVGSLPPASPFAELLRRSRFASYDPSIKQTYSAPPAYAHRGNWGLKRPISQRRKDAFITLKSYEDHAQYIEWNNAEAQVRFVKRFEELNVTPDVTAVSDTPWTKHLGPIQSSLWMTDSEFDVAKDSEYRYHVEEVSSQSSVEGNEEVQETEKEVSLDELGGKGKGGYGANSPIGTRGPLVMNKDKPWNYRQPNVEAMTASEFQSYLQKLRSLRPAFLQEIRAQLQERAKKGEFKGTMLNPDISDMQLAVVNSISNDHRAFINNHYEEEYARREEKEMAASDPFSEQALPKDFVRKKIKPQPHRFGGLTYAHPTLLDTYFSTSPQPAFALNGQSASRAQRDKQLQVSFGGVVADLKNPRVDIQPLFTNTSGPQPESVDNSVVNVRVQSFKLFNVPRVVGKDAQGLNGVHVGQTVVEDVPHAWRAWDNTKTPGSFEYSAAPPTHMRPVSLDRYPKTLKSSAFVNPKAQKDAIKNLMSMVGGAAPRRSS